MFSSDDYADENITGQVIGSLIDTAVQKHKRRRTRSTRRK